MAARAAKKRKTGGRKPGTPNKLTAAVKGAVLGALEEVGGQRYLVGIARKNPAVFCALLGRLIPTEVKTSGGVTVRVEVTEQVVDQDHPPDDPPASGPGRVPA